MLPGLLSVHSQFMIGLFDKEQKIRSAGSCVFDDWFDVHEANVGEGATTAVCMSGTSLY